jgi:retron-type reverse transcriptase
VSPGLDRVRNAARQRKKEKFTALLHHVTVDLLRDAFLALKRRAAPGVDGVTWQDYEANLEGNLQVLHSRVHRGTYRAQPVRRRFIPKPGTDKQRPLGIAALEDKIVQRAVVVVLNAIYEEDFLGFSYGFRPARGPHDALDALSVAISDTRVNWILDADIRSFFDGLSQEWLVRFLRHRIGDERILRLVLKWLKAGVLEEGKWSVSETGTPQGAVMTPRTQKETSTAWRAGSAAGSCRAALRRRCRTDGDAMPDDDRVVADEDVLDDEAHDPLSLNDVKRIGGAAQTTEERRERLGKA